MVENWLFEMQIPLDLFRNLSQNERDKIESLMIRSQTLEQLSQLQIMTLENDHVTNLMETCFFNKEKLSKGTLRNFQSLCTMT